MISLLQAMRWFQSARLVHIVGPLATPGKECPPLKTTDLNQNSVFKNQNFTVVVFHNKTNRLFNARAGHYDGWYIFGRNLPDTRAGELFKLSIDLGSLVVTIKFFFQFWVLCG